MGKINFKGYKTLRRTEQEYEIFTDVSQTVPDQSMSMRDLLHRYAQGLPMGGSRQPFYDEENMFNGVNPKTLDLVDIQEMKMKNDAQIKDLQAQQLEQNEAKQKKAANAAAAARQAIIDEAKKQLQIPNGQ